MISIVILHSNEKKTYIANLFYIFKRKMNTQKYPQLDKRIERTYKECM